VFAAHVRSRQHRLVDAVVILEVRLAIVVQVPRGRRTPEPRRRNRLSTLCREDRWRPRIRSLPVSDLNGRKDGRSSLGSEHESKAPRATAIFEGVPALLAPISVRSFLASYRIQDTVQERHVGITRGATHSGRRDARAPSNSLVVTKRRSGQRGSNKPPRHRRRALENSSSKSAARLNTSRSTKASANTHLQSLATRWTLPPASAVPASLVHLFSGLSA
jgi:hypothetical protein